MFGHHAEPSKTINRVNQLSVDIDENVSPPAGYGEL
jgi:hypothetical protein